MTCTVIPLEPCRIDRPAQQTVPVVYDSPHSGRFYPDDYGYSCELALLRSTEDSFVDELYSGAVENGAPLLAALFARNYIDVNRAEDDIDPDLLESDWPVEYVPSVRSAAGHGIIHRLVKSGFPIYSRRLSVREVQNRIDRFYTPYHQALKNLVDTTFERFGKVWHINCHSMNSLTAPTGSAFRHRQADFVLGDLDGTSCEADFTNSVKDFLSGLGYSVYVNDPYKGVEIVSRYSDPKSGRYSLQIEINKALYLDEQAQEKSNNFNALKDDLKNLSQHVGDFALNKLS